MKSLLKKIIPKFLFPIYHFLLAYLAAFYYGFPSNKLIVIGVTGTAGKSTTVNLIAKVLEGAGYSVGLTSTMNFKIGDKEWLNKMKMTMPGRFVLQKYLQQMIKAGCQYAVIETSSEGIKQFRHLGINYDILVFTNLTPEHIEAHGSWEKYRQAKEKLFSRLAKLPRKKLFGREIKKDIIVNLDDKNVEYFLKYWAEEKWGYGIKFKIQNANLKMKIQNSKFIEAEDIETTSRGISFKLSPFGRPPVGWQVTSFKLQIMGEFNVYNSLATICVGLSQNIPLEKIKSGLEKINYLAGRLEEINLGQAFKVFVDYAHTPESLEQVYKTLRPLTKGKIIAVLGACGGGRDRAKRPKMGEIAAQLADRVIITNEDPYDEEPNQILSEIKSGIPNSKLQTPNSFYEILDRGEAIKKAIALAQEGDTVIITGKGSEQWMMGPKGEKIPWDDREIAGEIIKNIVRDKGSKGQN